MVPSMYIGFACLPQSYQPLPKNHQCTIIGWGKRKNTDEAGTNILHEAEVHNKLYFFCGHKFLIFGLYLGRTLFGFLL